jgi:hypothetical protein
MKRGKTLKDFGKDTRCIEGQLWEHNPQEDDPYLEKDKGECPECEGKGCSND